MVWTNVLHDLLLNLKCSSHWFKREKIEDQVNQIVSFYQGYLDLIKCYRKRFFAFLKRIKSYSQSTSSQQSLNHFMVLHIHVNLVQDVDLIQVANYMVLEKSEKRSNMANLCKVQTVQSSYCVYASMFVLIKWNVNTWDEYFIYLIHISPQFISPKFKFPPKAKKLSLILLKYP